MNAALFDDIKLFTVSELGLSHPSVTEHTALAHDLGVAGLDGKEFMEAFASKFRVELGAFDWLEYFGAEARGNPLGLFGYLYKGFVRGIPSRHLVGLPEITLGNLVLCANLGKWQRPS